MDIPAWKYWLSYLTEVHIESAPSDINPHLYVSMRKGRLLLCSENAVYSYEDRYDNFRLLFEEIDIGAKDFGSVLVLGMGLGSVPLLLEKSGLKIDRMSMVEIDEEVVYLAEKYGLVRLETPYTIYTTDARTFLTAHSAKYDLVISDIFLDDIIPDYFLSEEYLHSLRDLLNPAGLVIINTLASTDKDQKASKAYFEQTFSLVFPDGELRHTWENYMLMSRFSGYED